MLTRLARDDTHALELALSRHWALVVDYIARITGSEDAAEDAALSAFCQFWDRRGEWSASGAGSLRALLCRMARNAAVSEHRRQLADERSAVAFLELNAPPARGAAESIDSERLRVLVAREIDRLPERRREIVVLRCYHDLSYREIADVMEIAEQTVANQLSRALAQLRTTLAGALD